MFRIDMTELVLTRPITAWKVVDQDGNGPYQFGFARVGRWRFRRASEAPTVHNYAGWYVFEFEADARRWMDAVNPGRVIPVSIKGRAIRGQTANSTPMVGYRAEFIRRRHRNA